MSLRAFFCEALSPVPLVLGPKDPGLTKYRATPTFVQEGDCFVAKSAPRNDKIGELIYLQALSVVAGGAMGLEAGGENGMV